eukprot:89950-Chlamydomonas_euryale.AAC.3
MVGQVAEAAAWLGSTLCNGVPRRLLNAERETRSRGRCGLLNDARVRSGANGWCKAHVWAVRQTAVAWRTRGPWANVQRCMAHAWAARRILSGAGAGACSGAREPLVT